MVSFTAFLGTFLGTTVFFAVTLHVAARWVVGESPARKAVIAAPFPAVVVVATGIVGAQPAVQVGAAVVVDLVAIGLVYELRARLVAALAVVHIVISVVFGIAVQNIVAYLFGG